MKKPDDETSPRAFRQEMEQNMEKRSDSPSEEASVHNHSRRKFLAAAGASALTIPFLSRAADAQTCVMNACPVTTDCEDTTTTVIPPKESCKVDPVIKTCCTATTPPGSPADGTLQATAGTGSSASWILQTPSANDTYTAAAGTFGSGSGGTGTSAAITTPSTLTQITADLNAAGTGYSATLDPTATILTVTAAASSPAILAKRPPTLALTPPPSCSSVSYADDGKWLIRGCIPDTACGYNAANIRISGVRHYCGKGNLVSYWPPRLNQTSGQSGPFFCMTIYPNINDLISKPMGQNVWDPSLHTLFSTAYGRDMLSCWHEVAYTGSTPHKYDATGEPITSFYEKKMQDYLLEFRTCYGYTAPAIGAIECDNGDKDSDGTPNYGIPRIAPFVTSGLDFVADDLYYTNQKDPYYCLTAWDNQWGHGAGTNATISVAECNVSGHYDWQTLRAPYFKRVANTLWNQKNKGARCFLTFWRYDGYVGLSGPWVASDTDTISALQAIGSANATFPDPGPVPTQNSVNSAVCWSDIVS